MDGQNIAQHGYVTTGFSAGCDIMHHVISFPPLREQEQEGRLPKASPPAISKNWAALPLQHLEKLKNKLRMVQLPRGGLGDVALFCMALRSPDSLNWDI